MGFEPCVAYEGASKHGTPSAAGTRHSRGLAKQLRALRAVGEIEQEKEREARSDGVANGLRAAGECWRDEDFAPAWPTHSRSLRLFVCSWPTHNRSLRLFVCRRREAAGLREAAVEPACSAKETHACCDDALALGSVAKG